MVSSHRNQLGKGKDVSNNRNTRTSSSSSTRPSPPVDSPASDGQLDLGFLSSSSESSGNSRSSNSTTPVSQRPARFRLTPHPAAMQRQRVRDRSLSKTSERLYRRVNNRLSAFQSSTQGNVSMRHGETSQRSKSMHGFNRCHRVVSHNGRSKSLRGSHFEQIIDELLGKKDCHISIEYLCVSSSPQSPSVDDAQAKHDSRGATRSSSKRASNMGTNGSQSPTRGRSRSKPVAKEVNEAESAIYLNGPEHKGWHESVHGSAKPILLSFSMDRPIKVNGMFRSQLRRFRESKEVAKPVRDKGNEENNSALSRKDESSPEGVRKEAIGVEAPFYLDGPEYNAWLASVNGHSRKQAPPLHMGNKRAEITGMFKSILRSFRKPGRVKQQRKSNEVVPDVSWGNFPIPSASKDGDQEGQAPFSANNVSSDDESSLKGVGKEMSDVETPFYLDGPEYNAWLASVNDPSRKPALPLHKNRVQITGMFKSVLKSFRKPGRVKQQRKSNKVVADVSWGNFPIQSVSKGRDHERKVPISTRGGTLQRTTSCFATPISARIEGARKSRSSFVQSPVRLASTTMVRTAPHFSPASTSSSRGGTMQNVMGLLRSEAEGDNGIVQLNSTNVNGSVYKHSAQIGLHMLVDGKPRMEDFELKFESPNVNCDVQVLELLVDKQPIWRRNRVPKAAGGKKTSDIKK